VLPSTSFTIGVGHEANFATCSRLTVCFFPSSVFPVADIFSIDTERPPEGVLGVGHPLRAPPQPLSKVRRFDACSRESGRPEGVACAFQVSRHKIEPPSPSRARNLFAKDDWRLALLDEPVEGGPKVPLVSKPALAACRAERLAGARSGPDLSTVGPPCEAQGIGPPPDAGEEVTLRIAPEVSGEDIFDASFIHISWGNQPLLDQFPEPRGSFGIDLVVVGSTFLHLPTLQHTFPPCQASRG
jgi:hypothetical protein